MQIKHNALTMIHGCENAIHNAFQNHSGNEPKLRNELGSIKTEFGSDAMMVAMTNCLRVAYLRLGGHNR